MQREVERELRDIAEDVLERAEPNISASPPPNEDPDEAVSLRESGRVGEVRRRGDRSEITVGFYAVYAAAQHEGAWSYLRDDKRVVAKVRHHPGGGKTKYLEDVIKAMHAEYSRRLARASARALRG